MFSLVEWYQLRNNYDLSVCDRAMLLERCQRVLGVPYGLTQTMCHTSKLNSEALNSISEKIKRKNYENLSVRIEGLQNPCRFLLYETLYISHLTTLHLNLSF